MHPKNWEECTDCALSVSRGCAVLGAGENNAKVMFIDGMPGPDEDATGYVLQGKENKYFHETIRKAGLAMEDIFFTYSVACAPLAKKPLLGEMAACRPRILEEILWADPDVILLLGNIPLRQLLGINKPASKMQMRTFILDVPSETGTLQYPCIVTYSLQDILKNPSKNRNQPWHFFYRAVCLAKKASDLSRGGKI